MTAQQTTVSLFAGMSAAEMHPVIDSVFSFDEAHEAFAMKFPLLSCTTKDLPDSERSLELHLIRNYVGLMDPFRTDDEAAPH